MQTKLSTNSSYGKIYRLTNKINSKMYHGQTIEEDINDRWAHYKHLNCKGQKKLYPALKKYGWNNFLAEVIDTTPQNQSQLDDLETFYIAKFDSMNNGYNCDPGGRNGGKRSEETKRKISEANSGEKHHMFGRFHLEESKRKMSISHNGENNPNFGKKMSDKQRQKISIANKGKIGSNLGKHFSEETKQRISLSKRGENNPHFGKPRSEETKIKISEKNKETKRKKKEELIAPPSGIPSQS